MTVRMNDCKSLCAPGVICPAVCAPVDGGPSLTLDPPAADGSAFPDVPSGTTWIDDPDAIATVGDYVRGSLLVTVALGAKAHDINLWVASVSRKDVEDLWNRELEKQGLSQRMRVVAFREILPRGTDPDTSNPQIEFELVGQVVKNAIGVLAWVLIAVAAAALVDVIFADGRIIAATGRLLGTFLSDVADPVVKGTLIPLLVAVGAVLLIAAYVFR